MGKSTPNDASAHPDWSDEIRRRLAGLRLSAVREEEIVEELTQHLDDRYHELITAGSSSDSAFHTALTELLHTDLFVRELQQVERPVGSEVLTVPDDRMKLIEGVWQDVPPRSQLLQFC